MLSRKKFLYIALGVASAFAIAAGVACGGDSDSDGDTSSPDVAAGGGMTVPNTLMTFEGERFRLSDLLQADLVDKSEFEQIGVATEADIEYQGELAVYSRAGDDEAVWTLMEASEGGDGEGTPALWYRWAPDSEGGAAE